MNANGSHTAEVTALTAEVRALMVGSRQVTLSVYRQLDWVGDDENFEPFGRVRDKFPSGVEMVGRDGETGSLVRARCWSVSPIDNGLGPPAWEHWLLHRALEGKVFKDRVLVSEDRDLRVFWEVRFLKECPGGKAYWWGTGDVSKCPDSTSSLWQAWVPVAVGDLEVLRKANASWKDRQSLPLIVLAGLR